MSKKRGWLKIVGVVVLLLLVAVLAFVLFLNSILKGSIEKVGSLVTKSDISIEKVDLSLLKGELLLENFKVGNPEGYKTDSAFSLTKVFVSLKPSSLMSDTIRITEVQIIDPSLTFEAGLGNSNLGTILDNVNRFVPSGDPDKAKEKEKAESDKKGKKVQIDHVVVKGGKIRLSAKILGGAALPIPLPGVELSDIGKEEEEKVGMVEASALIFKEMLTGAIGAVGSAASAVVEGGKAALESTGKAAADAGKAAVDAGKAALEGTGKAAADAGKAAADAGKAAADAGKAAADAGKKLGKGLMNVLGGSKEEEAPAQ
jgi:uncharacterized protein involved in outer membrane biogenesis